MGDVKVGITIKNLPQIRRAFGKAPQIVGPHINKAIRLAVLKIGRDSRINTPVDTGRLRASTREVFRPMYGEIGTHTNYDIFVHEGTRFMRARPYLRQAVEANEGFTEDVFTRELQQALNEIARLT